MAPDSLQKCPDCGRGEPEVHFVVQDFVRSYPRRGLVRVHRVARVCDSCRGAKGAKARIEGWNRWRAEKLAAREQTCKDCGVTKPATRVFFSVRPNGLLFKRCRVCARLWVKAYRRTASYKRWLDGARERRREKCRELSKSPTSRARLREWHLAHFNPLARKYRQALTDAIEKGEIVRPAICSCGVPGRLRALFVHGLSRWREVEFVCFKCYYQRTRGIALRARQAREDREDFAGPAKRTIYCTPEEWLKVHEENVRALAEEEKRLASLRLDTSPAGRRKLFLVSVGLTRREADEIIGREGPMECVLGHWLPKR